MLCYCVALALSTAFLTHDGSNRSTLHPTSLSARSNTFTLGNNPKIQATRLPKQCQEPYLGHVPLEKVTQLSHTSKLVFVEDKSSHRQEYPQFPPLPAEKSTGLVQRRVAEAFSALCHSPKPLPNLTNRL